MKTALSRSTQSAVAPAGPGERRTVSSSLRKVRRPEPPGAVWQLWPGRNRPLTAIEELAFIEELTALAEALQPELDLALVEHSRGDVTAVMNALRCGLDAEDLLRRAPGLVPGRLVAAHTELNLRREESVEAWSAIAAGPTFDVFQDHAAQAALLLPVIIGEVAEQAHHGEVHLAAKVRAAAIEVDRVGRVARTIEDWMISSDRSNGDGARIGRLLYDLDEPGMWSHEYFLAPRAGTVVPTRLAALLGERSMAAL